MPPPVLLPAHIGVNLGNKERLDRGVLDGLGWELPVHELGAEANLPRVRLHDLRHLAATLMLASGVPLAVTSKMLRHSQVGITADLYGHLTREASHAAADGLAAVLDAAAAELVAERAVTGATTARPLGELPSHLRR